MTDLEIIQQAVEQQDLSSAQVEQLFSINEVLINSNLTQIEALSLIAELEKIYFRISFFL